MSIRHAILALTCLIGVTLGTGNPSAAQPDPDGSLRKALEYSTRGIALLLVLGRGDDVSHHKALLKELMLALNEDKVPAKIFGVQSGGDRSFLVYFVNAAAHPSIDAAVAGGGYHLDSQDMGRLRADANNAYRDLKQRAATLAQLEQQQAALARRLKDIDTQIAKNNDEIAASKATIAKNNMELARIRQQRKAIEAAQQALAEGRLPARNPDGTFRDAWLETAIKDYEKRRGVDRSNPAEVLRALEVMGRDLQTKDARE